jgi:dihydroneopterin aldolase
VDRILIPGIPVRVRVGVPDEERASEQGVLVGLALYMDLAPAGASDRLEDTVDYEAVCSAVVAVAAERPFRLIETLAEAVAAVVLGGFPVSGVEVRVEKPGALVERGVPFAAVEILRGHHG